MNFKKLMLIILFTALVGALTGAGLALWSGTRVMKAPSADDAANTRQGKTASADNTRFQIHRDVARLVEGFPDVPAYPGAVFKGSDKRTRGSAVGYEAKWETEDAIVDVVPYYLHTLPEYGWAWTANDRDALLVTGEAVVEISRGAFFGTLTVEREESGSSAATEIRFEFPIR